jgi:hypothetical protein
MQKSMLGALGVITNRMGYRNAGRLVGLFAGPLLLVVILGASPSPPASTRVAAREIAIVSSEGGAAPSGVSVAPTKITPAAGPTTSFPDTKCPITESPIAACHPCLPAEGIKQPTATCQSCPRTFTEGPLLVRCPGPTSPPPTGQQPPAHPSISVCAVPGQSQPGFVAAYGAVCGVGFRAGESLTLTAGGARGVSWTSHADGAGRFRAVLPPALCRVVPISLVVAGSAGDRSNTLTVTRNTCLPRP